MFKIFIQTEASEVHGFNPEDLRPWHLVTELTTFGLYHIRGESIWPDCHD